MASITPNGLRTKINVSFDEITIKIKFSCTPEVSKHIGDILQEKHNNNFELMQILPHYLRNEDFIIEETHRADTSDGKSVYGCTLQASNIIIKK